MPGHFESGSSDVAQILGIIFQAKSASYWSQGAELQGWALLWRQVYSQVKHYLGDPLMRKQISGCATRTDAVNREQQN